MTTPAFSRFNDVLALYRALTGKEPTPEDLAAAKTTYATIPHAPPLTEEGIS